MTDTELLALPLSITLLILSVWQLARNKTGKAKGGGPIRDRWVTTPI